MVGESSVTALPSESSGVKRPAAMQDDDASNLPESQLAEPQETPRTRTRRRRGEPSETRRGPTALPPNRGTGFEGPGLFLKYIGFPDTNEE